MADAPHCDARAIRINLVYSVATFAFMSSNLPTGLMADRLGPRRTATLCNAAAGAAALMIAIPPAWGVPVDTFFVGVPMLAFFGPGLEVSFASVANLFPGNEGTVIGTTSGMMGGSAVTFPIYAAINRAVPGANLTALFLAHAAVAFASAAAALLQPRRTVAQKLPASEEGGAEGDGDLHTRVNPLFKSPYSRRHTPRAIARTGPGHGASSGATRSLELTSASTLRGPASDSGRAPPAARATDAAGTAGVDPGAALSPRDNEAEGPRRSGVRQSVAAPPLLVGTSDAPLEEDEPPPTPPGSSKWVSLWHVCTSREMLALMAFFVVHYLRLAFYLGTASLQFSRVGSGSPAQAAHLLTMLSWIAPFGAVSAPLIGALDDARGHRFAIGVVHALGLLHCGAMLSPWVTTQVVGMAVYTVQQECIFAVGQARALKLVPAYQFGAASGVFLMVGAAARYCARQLPRRSPTFMG